MSERLRQSGREDLPAEVDAGGKADPTIVPPPAVSGGIGGTDDGTQVTREVPTAIPGKPMAPIATDPNDRSSFEGRAQHTPPTEPHGERGGSG